jgi:hypothetical protein
MPLPLSTHTTPEKPVRPASASTSCSSEGMARDGIARAWAIDDRRR